MILDLYYKIWVDGITKLRSIPANKGMWKFYAMVFISMAMAINLALVMAILQRNILKHSFYDVHIDILGIKKLDYFVSFVLLYLLIPLLISYFLIFRNKRYEMLINKYKSYNGKLCVSYLMISYFLPFILIIVAFLLGR
jgi:hypothetical protein